MISFYYTYVFVLTHTLHVFEISLPVWSYWAILIKYSCQFNFLAMGSKQLSGNMVELSTFWTWGKKEVIGHKTLSLPNSKIMVNHIWCKVCAAHTKTILWISWKEMQNRVHRLSSRERMWYSNTWYGFFSVLFLCKTMKFQNCFISIWNGSCQLKLFYNVFCYNLI